MRRWAGRLGRALLFAAVLLSLAATIVPFFLDRIYYAGPASGHFDGARFFNPDGDDTRRPPGGGGRAGFLWRQLTGSDARPAWPATVPVRQAKPAARVEGTAMVATWIGHATVLIQTQGMNILTDPIYAERAGPFGFGPKRVAAPGVRFADLPPIDLVVVSHNHYDHMDLATLKRLWDRDRPVFVTSLGNDALLRGAGIPARDRSACAVRCPGVEAVDWGAEPAMVTGRRMAAWRARPVGAAPIVRVSVVRNHHWGSRWFRDRNRALWSAFVIDVPGSGAIFFAGDTGFGDGRWTEEARAAARGPIRLALIPIGAFRFSPGEMGTGSHIGPVDAVAVARRLGAQTALPIHWGTYRLSYEAWGTPPLLLDAAMACTRQPGRFAGVPIGRPIPIPPLTTAPVVARPAMDRAALLRCLDTPAVRALR